ncbi:L-arabinose 1-dehydrogenase (NAD(P)(+)) [Candidatus Anstonella stagnisolia]|nr:L-arabinose 1-dehydrogenase (NAD(P)(+)) [Candidatus Anstonella stagnisolia]
MFAVSGGSGFIGSHLCNALAAAKGEKPICIDVRAPASAQQCIYKKADVRDLGALVGAIGGCETMFHLAAQVSVQKSIEDPKEDFEINAKGTQNCLEACRKNSVKTFVYASSAAIYGTPQYVPVDEKHPTLPLSPYGNSKLEGEKACEQYCRTYGMRTVCLRFFNVYGIGQSPSSPYSGVITKFSTRIKNNEPPVIFGSGSQTRDFVHVGDVVRACILASESKNSAGKAYNIGTGKETSVLGLATTMIKLSGRKLQPQFRPALEGEIEKSVAQIGLAKKDFGFSPKTSLEDGLRELL